MYDSFATDRLIDLWLTEDIGACDLTVQVMIEPGETGKFQMNAREPMIVAGQPFPSSTRRRSSGRTNTSASPSSRGSCAANGRPAACSAASLS